MTLCVFLTGQTGGQGTDLDGPTAGPLKRRTRECDCGVLMLCVVGGTLVDDVVPLPLCGREGTPMVGETIDRKSVV